MKQHTSNPPLREEETGIDWVLVLGLLRRRRKTLAIAGAAIWIGSLLICLFFVPRTYTATASVAMQQSGSPVNPLALLSGINDGTKNYQGVLYSHTFAAYAAQEADIKAIYGLPKESRAIELVQHAVKVEDRQDGLLYININLPAPPRFAFWQRRRAELIQRASARIAGDYVVSLQRYLASSNTDRDADLVREARKQLVVARKNYNNAVGKLAAMLMKAPATTLASAAGGAQEEDATTGSMAGKSDAVAAQLQALYVDKSQIDTEIQAMRAAQQATVGIVASSPESVASLPGEDPLLQQARAQVRMDQTELDNLEVTLSDDNPDVVAARQRLAIAQNMLASQSRAIAQGKTTEGIDLDSLKARYAAVQQQIAHIERSIKGHSASTIALEYQRNEVMLSLEVLKATATQYATLSVTKVAGNNLMDVVDTPLVPEYAQPGLALFLAVTLFFTLLVLQGWIAIEYALSQLRHRIAIPTPGTRDKAA